MKHLSESILDLLQNAATVAGEAQNEWLAQATANALDALHSDGGIGGKDAWVYQSIMHGMVQSGALRVTGQDVISSRMPLHE
jgi:hypothetical protein